MTAGLPERAELFFEGVLVSMTAEMKFNALDVGNEANAKDMALGVIDFEWVTLIATARDLGISKQSICEFLTTSRQQNEAATASEE